MGLVGQFRVAFHFLPFESVIWLDGQLMMFFYGCGIKLEK
jgi:predicted transcriptional regulator